MIMEYKGMCKMPTIEEISKMTESRYVRVKCWSVDLGLFEKCIYGYYIEGDDITMWEVDIFMDGIVVSEHSFSKGVRGWQLHDKKECYVAVLEEGEE